MIGTDAEQALIGAVLLDSRSYRFAADIARPEDFSTVPFELIFAGVGRMLAKGEHVDVITVGGKLGDWEVRGLSPADLHVLTGMVPHVGAAGSYAQQVHDDAVRRAIRVSADRALQSVSGVTPPGEVLANVINELQQVQAGATSTTMTAQKLAQVLAGVDDYDWVVPDLLERRDRLILTGGEGAGKSTFVRQMAIASAAGVHPITFAQIDPVNVLVVDAENSEKQWRRSARWLVQKSRMSGTVDPAETVNLVCAPRLDLTRDAHLGQVHRLLDAHKPDVLFIGPLYRLTPRAINSDDDAAPLLAALDTLRDRGVALVMEAHAGHALGVGGERDLRPRGSAALMGWPEFGLGIRVDRENPETFNLVPWRGGRDTREWPTQMRRGHFREEFPWVPLTPMW